MSLHDHPETPDDSDVASVRIYIADMLCELAKLAAVHDDDELAIAIHHAAQVAAQASAAPSLTH